MKISDLGAVAERYLAAWAAHDLDAIVALHSADGVFRLHTGGAPAIGRDAGRSAFAAILEQFPALTVQVHRVLLGDRHWVLDWTLVSGQRRLDCLDLVELSDAGLVARKDTFVDAAQLPAALGAA